MDKLHGSLVGLYAHIRYNLVDEVVLAVAKSTHCLNLCRVIRVSFVELDSARAEKVANTVETGLAIHIESVVRGKIEGTECFPAMPRTLLKVLVEHLFPALRVEAGGVRYYTVEIKEDGVVLIAADAPDMLPHDPSPKTSPSFLPQNWIAARLFKFSFNLVSVS
jgi:hypothetical protein